ncbi:NAD(P)/FAD-dependent oxidoreductase [Nesterenkonia alkaliphila]|uniref:NAD(P)/FAD-dependent oxidoreductase n=1 Tax=Nesterenkonia alkaliphila TaxID=1463631 RepID=A0A7K1UJG2_9MICC|nr:FAD-dependent oxidoreductase [Nesterenkonia alkaliphila]MVT26617.1 NAD(P)/FAD-dependent oxidoreductase [Nesterenkonia alkaliphila]GFZ92224.1 NADH dehydrogenase [Nesterenkonia alkaliphila]
MALKLSEKPRVLIVGGGYVGLTVAQQLQKKIKAAGGIVTLVDPLPYMTYQPFLPEVVGGHIEARHAVVPHRRHLKDTEVITGKVTSVDHQAKIAVVGLGEGESVEIPYQDIVMAAGATTRTFPIEGLAENGIGLKTIEEALGLRNHILERLEAASVMTDEAAKRRALTFTVVGGGFAGIECIAEMEDIIRAAVNENPRLSQSDVRIVLVEAMGRIMPEVSEDQAVGVVEHLRGRGIEVLLNTSLSSAVDGELTLISMADKSEVDKFGSDTLVWTAGVAANAVARSSSFPVDERGRITGSATLQILNEDGDVIEGAWTAGDIAAIPDLTGAGPGGFCVPNAQHASRQAKVLAKNLFAVRYGTAEVAEYKHESLGAVAGLGLYKGVGNPMGVKLKGVLAWAAHRGYHGMAIPTIERKARVAGGWVNEMVFGRDVTPLRDLENPTKAFFEAAGGGKKKATK